MTSKTIQAITAAAAAIFMLGALLGMSSCEAPPPEAAAAHTQSPAAQPHPWQGMTDEELMAGVVLEPLGEQP